MFDEQVFEEMKMSALPISSVLTTPRPVPARRHLRVVPDLPVASTAGPEVLPPAIPPARPSRPRPGTGGTARPARPARPRPVGAVRPVPCAPGARGQVPGRPQGAWARLRRVAEGVAMAATALGTVAVVVLVAAAVAGFGPLA